MNLKTTPHPLRFVVGVAIVFFMAFVGLAVLSPANARSPGLTKEMSQKRLAECISKNHDLSVLFLVDESSSLRDTNAGTNGSDPNNRRVDGMKAAIAGLQVSASIDDRTRVSVAFLGFGEDVTERSKWIPITELDQLNSKAEEFAVLNNERGTNYIAGLAGSYETLVQRSEEIGRPNCRLLVWLTDGAYDIDRKTKLSSKELRQLQNVLCGDGGTVDQLRQLGTTIVGVGLSGENEIDFSWVQKVVGDKPGCGNDDPNGWFIPVANANGLVDELFKGISDPTNGPKQLGSIQPCSDKPTDCAEIAFDVTKFITRFRILVQPTIPTDIAPYLGSVLLIAPDNATTVNILPMAAGVNSIQVEKYYDSRALVKVDFTEAMSDYWVGVWRIRFEGGGAIKSQALAIFLSDYKAELAIGQEPSIDRAKSETKALKISLSSSDVPNSSEGESSVGVPQVLAALMFEPPIILKVELKSGSSYEISAESLKSLFADPESVASIASDATLELTPVLEVNGLPITFSSSQFAIALRDGDMYPSVKVSGTVRIDQRKKGRVILNIQGPKQGDGVVRFGKAVSEVVSGDNGISPNDFTLSGVPNECIVLELSSSSDCSFEIAANFQRNSEFSILIPIEIDNRVGARSEGPKSLIIKIPVAMTKPISTSKSILAGIELLALFLAVQLLLRFTFALAMSRFERLPEGSRRTIASVKLTPNGEVLSSDGTRFDIRNEDAELVFQMDRPFRRLEVGGFLFAVSLLRTFLTQQPVGVISAEGSEVFGSLGRSQTKRIKGSFVGLIGLAPRQQWAIAVSLGNLALLESGQDSVDARLIAFFDDITKTPLSQQSSELLERITTSTLVDDLRVAFDEIRSAKDDKAEVEIKLSDPNGGNDEEPGNASLGSTAGPRAFDGEKSGPATYFDPNDPLN